MFTIVVYCLLFCSRVRVRIVVRIRFSVGLVSCYAHVFVQLLVGIVTLLHTSACAGESIIRDDSAKYNT